MNTLYVMKPREFEIYDITLLDVIDFKNYRHHISAPKLSLHAFSDTDDTLSWWLLPKDEETLAMVKEDIDISGDADIPTSELQIGNINPFDVHGIRPAIITKDLSLEMGTKVMFQSDVWTVIAPNLLLCDTIVDTASFFDRNISDLVHPPYDFNESFLNEVITRHFWYILKSSDNDASKKYYNDVIKK